MKSGCGSTSFLLLANLLTLGALSFHVVVRPESKVPVLVTKSHLTFVDTYVDVRTWTPADVAKHPLVVARLAQTDRLNVIPCVADQQTPAGKVGGICGAPLTGAVTAGPTVPPTPSAEVPAPGKAPAQQPTKPSPLHDWDK